MTGCREKNILSLSWSEKNPAQSGIYLSVIIPVYNEAENVNNLGREILSVLDGAGYGYEVLFVDDGSEDRTAALLEQLERDDEHVRLLRHSINCGQSAAIATGFRFAGGAWVATLDGDGKNDPLDLPRMLALAETAGVDCVTGIRVDRCDTWL